VRFGWLRVKVVPIGWLRVKVVGCGLRVAGCGKLRVKVQSELK
jgi:hypothetical protein